MAKLTAEPHPDHLVLALDGSRASEAAVPVTVQLATRGELPVSVVHVFDTIRALSSHALEPIEWGESAEPRARIRPPASIRSSVEELIGNGIDVNVIGRIGDVSEQISAEARLHSNPWVIITSLGETGMRRILLGSNAIRTIRTLRSPVLVIPSTFEAPGTSRQTDFRVALLLDGTARSEQAIDPACSAARIFDAELDIVRVEVTNIDHARHDQPTFASEAKLGAPGNAVTQYVEEIAAQCAKRGLQSNPAALCGTPAIQIREYVAAHRPSMIVLATQRLSGIERWTYGSFAEQLIGELPTPTLLVPVEVGASN